MASLYKRFFDPKRFGVPYESAEEHILDLVLWCELLLSAYLPFFAPQISWRGLESLHLPESPDEVLRDFDKARFHIDARVRQSVQRGDFLAFQYTREVMKLSNLEYFALILWTLPLYDERFQALFIALRGKPAQSWPTSDLAVKLFHFSDQAENIVNYHRIRYTLEKKGAFAFLDPAGGLDRRIGEFLLLNGQTPLKHPIAETVQPSEHGTLPIREAEAKKLAILIHSNIPSQEPLYICLKGKTGSGRTVQIKRTAELLDVPVVFFDCGGAPGINREAFLAELYTAGRESLLLRGMLALKRFECLLEEPETARSVLDTAGQYSSVVFLQTQENASLTELASERRWLEYTVDPLNKEESIRLWEQELFHLPLTSKLNSLILANQFNFTPAQIAGTARTAEGVAQRNGPLRERELIQAAYRQITHKLGEHATLIPARHTWDQLVLSADGKEILQTACNQIRNRHIVYEQWGFNQRLTYGKGVSMLFTGPPGTGKTMAAQVVASDLGIEMYKVDLSRVVSKYIGETEKNLNKIFTEAKKANVILFFDETDAILGKRTEVKDAHDRNANLETSYLLQKMEEYDGVTIMATNYKENIDSAFFRRISYIIPFAFPDRKARREIWYGIFPKRTPLGTDVDLEYMAGQFELTGGSIKNIAVTAAFLAAESGEPVGMRHLLRAVKYEMSKQGKILLREDYGEYGYLLREDGRRDIPPEKKGDG